MRDQIQCINNTFTRTYIYILFHIHTDTGATFRFPCLNVRGRFSRHLFALRRSLSYFCKISVLQCVAVCCSVLQCVAVCCNVLQCVAVCCNVLQCGSWHPFTLQIFCSQCRTIGVLQCVAVCCSVLQCVALCCSVLQCVAVC